MITAADLSFFKQKFYLEVMTHGIVYAETNEANAVLYKRATV